MNFPHCGLVPILRATKVFPEPVNPLIQANPDVANKPSTNGCKCETGLKVEKANSSKSFNLKIILVWVAIYAELEISSEASSMKSK